MQYMAMQQRKGEIDNKVPVELHTGDSCRCESLSRRNGGSSRQNSNKLEHNSYRSTSRTLCSGINGQHTSTQSQSHTYSGNLTNQECSNTGDSQKSLSSARSVTLQKLNKLETILMQERRAREKAEEMLADMQERSAKERTVRRVDQARRQQDDVINALRNVSNNPENTNNLYNLQSIIHRRPNSPSANRPPISSIPL